MPVARAHELHAPGDANMRKATGDGIVVKPHQAGDDTGGKGVVDVKEAHHAKHDVMARCARRTALLHCEGDAPINRLNIGCAKVGVAAARGRRRTLSRGRGHMFGMQRYQPLCRGGRSSKNLLNALGIEVHHGGLALLKDAQLALEVVLKRGVFDGRDMVASDVQKAGDFKGNAEHAVVLEALARHLHEHHVSPSVNCIAQMKPQVGCLGRGVVALKRAHAVVRLNRAQDGRRHTSCMQNGPQHVGNGRLPFGARDSHDGEVALRVRIDKRRHKRHGTANPPRCTATRGTPGACTASSSARPSSSQRYATAPWRTASARNAGRNAAPLQTKRLPGETSRESMAIPCTSVPSSPQTRASMPPSPRREAAARSETAGKRSIAGRCSPMVASRWLLTMKRGQDATSLYIEVCGRKCIPTA